MAGEESAGGGLFGSLLGRAGRQMGVGFSQTATASLKFDVPGLKEFRKEISGMRADIVKLVKDFESLSKSSASWYEQLKKVNEQLRQMRTNHPQQFSPGNLPMPTGQPIGTNAPAQPSSILNAATGSMGTTGGGLSQVISGLGATGGGGGAMAAMGGPAGIAIMVAEAVTKIQKAIATAAVKRFEDVRSRSEAADTFASRMYSAGYSPDQFRGFSQGQGVGLSGRMGMLGGFQEQFGARQQLYSMGMQFGAGGLGGQRGATAVAGAGMFQIMSPGLGAQEAAGLVGQFAANVRGQNQGAMLLGSNARMLGPGGRMKSPGEYFDGILKSLQQFTPTGRPLSKEQIQVARYPGSIISNFLVNQMGFTPEMLEAFFTYAEAKALYSEKGGAGAFTGTKAQMELVRGGPSQALAAMQTETREGQRTAAMAGEQYGAFVKREGRDQAVIGFLESIDHSLKGIYSAVGGNLPTNIFGNLPKMIGSGGFGMDLLKGTGLFGMFGDPGPETGMSHLNPDVRKRLGAMMSANPNVKIVSAYRDQNRQRRLWEGGHPFVAPPGKSKHTGQAVDLGPPSQYGWLKANARKFGLDMAGHLGEPWHAQLAGTLGFLGDTPQQMQQAATTAMGNQLLQGGWQMFFTSMSDVRQAATTAALSSALGGGSASGSTDTSGGSTGGTGVPGVGQLKTVSGKGGRIDVKGDQLSWEQTVQAFYNAGFRGEDLVKISAISQRESGRGTYRYALVPSTKDKSYGLTMMNAWGGMEKELLTYVKAAGGRTLDDLYDPQTSANATYAMYQRYGWKPWGGYKGVSELHNVKAEWLTDARTAATNAGFLGDAANGSYSQQMPPMAPIGTSAVPSIVFNNTFVIQGGGGVDADRTVRVVAQRLEPVIERAVRRRT